MSTNWRHVLIHAQEARWKGWFVEEYKLEQSPHCAHIRSNLELYAGIARRLWGFNVGETSGEIIGEHQTYICMAVA